MAEGVGLVWALPSCRPTHYLEKEVNMRLKGKKCSLWLVLVFLSVQVLAQDDTKAGDTHKYTVYEYVTCAVYFRMLIGALKRNAADLSSLEDIHMDQMNRAIRLGKLAAIEEWGEEDAKKEFDLEWQSEYGEMIAEIDRNFAKIRLLKMKYADLCDQMSNSTDELIKLTAASILPRQVLLD